MVCRAVAWRACPALARDDVIAEAEAMVLQIVASGAVVTSWSGLAGSVVISCTKAHLRATTSIMPGAEALDIIPCPGHRASFDEVVAGQPIAGLFRGRTELAVARILTEGGGIPEIAISLGISEGTARWLIARINRRLARKSPRR